LGPVCHNECAVNIVTESCPNLGFLTEKICKPLASYQIPILLSHPGATQFCQDAGFDMFEDLIPWRTWDNQPDENVKLELIANFVKKWIDSGTILDDYKQVQDRVERNKQYFHSDGFRDLIMKNMPRIDPYQLQTNWTRTIPVSGTGVL